MAQIAISLYSPGPKVPFPSAPDARLLDHLLRRSEEAASEVTHVTSAQAGLEAIEDSAYDRVRLDFYLPDIDGLVFLQTKRLRGLTTPVIMLAAFGQERLPVVAIALLDKAVQPAIERAHLPAEATTAAARVQELAASCNRNLRRRARKP